MNVATVRHSSLQLEEKVEYGKWVVLAVIKYETSLNLTYHRPSPNSREMALGSRTDWRANGFEAERSFLPYLGTYLDLFVR